MKLTDLHEGDIVKCDDRFTCLEHGGTRVVKLDSDGNLFIDCARGKHCLDGQVDDASGEVVGLVKV